MYWVEIRHDGLHKYRIIKGNDKYIVEQKAYLQQKQWDEMWERKQEIEKKKVDRENAAIEKAQKKGMAEQQTLEAKNQLEMIDHTLLYTLDTDDHIDWDSLMDKSKYIDPKPINPPVPSYSSEPKKSFMSRNLGSWINYSLLINRRKLMLLISCLTMH